MVSLTHEFVSAKADGTDSTLVKPSAWDAEHTFVTATDTVVLGRSAGAGAGPVQELPMSSVFQPGQVSIFAGATIPTGWLLCDGSLLNRADQPALFTAIGAAYNIGGEATTQFRLPDCRGRVIAMLDGGVGRLNGTIISNPNVVGGAGGAQSQAFSLHSTGTNNINFGNLGFNQTLGQIQTAGVNGLAFGGGGFASEPGDQVTVQGWTNVNGNFGIAVDGSSAVYTVQPTIMMNMMIKT
jgi:microcystin-dependent protein